MSDRDHILRELPVLVLFPHNRCNCRCVMCDIWRIRQVREITPGDIRQHLDSFRALGVREVVFSGGEAQLNRELATMASMLRAEGIHVTLLTAGLLLESRAQEVAETIDELIVSLDGPPAIHDVIRNVPRAFDRLAAGVTAVRKLKPTMRITARSTVQKTNFMHLRETVETAKQLGLDGISFLALDTTSSAFNRTQVWDESRCADVSLHEAEVAEFEGELRRLFSENDSDFRTGYIAEYPEKLQRIALHFRAALGQCASSAPRCNAPWVSAVIEADGAVRPCFFQPSFGNIHESPLIDIVNGERAFQFRRELNIETDATCRRCVCSLYRRVAEVTEPPVRVETSDECGVPPERPMKERRSAQAG